MVSHPLTTFASSTVCQVKNPEDWKIIVRELVNGSRIWRGWYKRAPIAALRQAKLYLHGKLRQPQKALLLMYCGCCSTQDAAVDETTLLIPSSCTAATAEGVVVPQFKSFYTVPIWRVFWALLGTGKLVNFQNFSLVRCDDVITWAHDTPERTLQRGSVH